MIHYFACGVVKVRLWLIAFCLLRNNRDLDTMVLLGEFTGWDERFWAKQGETIHA
jgi:hypothetical protein